NPPAPPATYTLSLHDALPIFAHGGLAQAELRGQLQAREHRARREAERNDLVAQVLEHLRRGVARAVETKRYRQIVSIHPGRSPRSEEHTSELQSQSNLVCRLL